ncbi:MAG: hypothetical protein KatS3mg110_1440 [Pirellulaceae bacterium]|nr:MAG: hypothetical protein KatS3mg110_1440 [Pirellulaceae bacterium]
MFQLRRFSARLGRLSSGTYPCDCLRSYSARVITQVVRVFLVVTLVWLPHFLASSQLQGQQITIHAPQAGTVFTTESRIDVGGSCWPANLFVHIEVKHIPAGQQDGPVMDSVGTWARYTTWGASLEPGPSGWKVGNARIEASLIDATGVVAFDAVSIVIQ